MTLTVIRDEDAEDVGDVSTVSTDPFVAAGKRTPQMLEMLGAVWTHDHEKERPAEVPDNHGSRNKSRSERRVEG